MAITPLGISGKDIPFLARILAVADSFDADVGEALIKII